MSDQGKDDLSEGAEAYIEKGIRLRRLIRDGKGDTPEAAELRDDMDHLWYRCVPYSETKVVRQALAAAYRGLE